MLLLYLARFLPAPLSALCISILYFVLVLSVAKTSNLTDLFNKFSMKTCVRTSTTFKSCLLSTICRTNSIHSVLPSKHFVIKSSSNKRNPLRRCKSSSCFLSIISGISKASICFELIISDFILSHNLLTFNFY